MTVNRNLDQATIPMFMTAAAAARILNVTRQTIQNACRRWDVGRRYQGTGKKTFLMLTKEDVVSLSARLQDGPGNKTQGDDE